MILASVVSQLGRQGEVTLVTRIYKSSPNFIFTPF